MIHSLSRTRVSLEREMMVDYESIVLHHHSKIRKELIQYYNSYSANCDSQLIPRNPNSCRSWWVNTKETLGQPITNHRIEAFLDALNGKMHVRNKLVLGGRGGRAIDQSAR